MRERLKDRYTIIAIIIVFVSSILVYQLAELQIVKGQYYDEQSQRKLLNKRKIIAPRGKITDRNGIPIAVNRMGFNVQVVNRDSDTQKFNDMLFSLIKLLEGNNNTYIKTLNHYITFNPIAYGDYIKNSQKDIKAFIKRIVLADKDVDKIKSPQDAFDYLRKEFKIDDKYSDEDAYKLMTIRFEMLDKGYSSLNPVTIATDVSSKVVAELEERNFDYPGIATDTQPIRKYIDSEAVAHVLGYIGGIWPEELKTLKDDGYDMSDLVGKDGIEKEAEKYLKGVDGEKLVEMDIGGRQINEIIGEGKSAIPGNDVELTIDMKLQKIAAESLKRRIDFIKNKERDAFFDSNIPLNFGDAFAGSVIAMDVTNGEILAAVSYPTYDPSVFLQPADNSNAQKAINSWLNDKVLRPMFNRTISGTYAPGSTYKPLVAVSALEEGIITPENNKILDPGSIEFDKQKFYCLEGGHGVLDLRKALATSCNIYFMNIATNPAMGIDKIDKWAKLFGLGEKTGIDLPNESGGQVSNKLIKAASEKRVYGTSYPWGSAHTAQSAIGQLYNSFTPIEIVNYISTLANGGQRFKPHIIRRVTKYDGSIVTETKPESVTVPVKKSTIDAVKEGMIMAANSEDGTAVEAFRDFPPQFKVAGKTGTAETTGNQTHSNNGVFICYAPADNPKIAVAVVIERGVQGRFAAPVAKDILMEYFRLNKVNDTVSDVIMPDEFKFLR